MIMLITSSHEIPYPSPYMPYVGMWVGLGDGPEESVYKSRGGKKGGGGLESAVKQKRRLPPVPPGALAGGTSADTQTSDLYFPIPSVSLFSLSH